MRTGAAVLAAGLVLLALAAREARHARSDEEEWFDAEAREGAARAAALFASLSAHLCASGGDPRFADRIPADPPVVAELLGDVAFAQHHGAVERPQLVRFVVRSVRPVGIGLAEVGAREYWITRSERAAGTSTRSDVVQVSYAMRREAGTWRVADWAIDSAPAEDAEPVP